MSDSDEVPNDLGSCSWSPIIACSDSEKNKNQVVNYKILLELGMPIEGVLIRSLEFPEAVVVDVVYHCIAA